MAVQQGQGFGLDRRVILFPPSLQLYPQHLEATPRPGKGVAEWVSPLLQGDPHGWLWVGGWLAPASSPMKAEGLSLLRSEQNLKKVDIPGSEPNQERQVILVNSCP